MKSSPSNRSRGPGAGARLARQATLAFGAILPILLLAGPAAADLFTVSRIPVEATAETATAARTRALAEAQRQAYERIVHRLVTRADWPKLPPAGAAAIEDAILGVEIVEERASATRYVGRVTVAFRADRIRRALREQGVPFTESLGRRTLVVPVVMQSGAAALWEPEAEAWRAAWARVAGQETLLNLTLPKGDDGDREALDAPRAAALDQTALGALARRNGASAVLVAILTAGAGGLEARTVRLDGARRSETRDQAPGDAAPEALLRLAQGIHDRMEEEWKQATLLRFEQRDRLLARAEFGDLASWLAIRKRLSEVPEVRQVEIAALTHREAHLMLTYLGDAERLGEALARRELGLVRTGDGWRLQLDGAAASAPAPAPAPTSRDEEKPAQ